MLTRALHTLKSATALTAIAILIGCGAGTSPMAPSLDEDGTFFSDDAVTDAPTIANVSNTPMDFNSDMGDIIEIDATGFDANANDLSQDLDEYDDSDAWYNDDDIVSPKEEDVSENPDSGEPGTQTSN